MRDDPERDLLEVVYRLRTLRSRMNKLPEGEIEAFFVTDLIKEIEATLTEKELIECCESRSR